MAGQKCGGGAAAMRKSLSGFSLLEALIALFVLSFGLIALASLQLKSLQYSQSSFQRNLALQQANDLHERLWASACHLNELDFSGCANNEICKQWVTEHSSSLPEWAGSLQKTSAADVNPIAYNIRINWRDTKLDATESFDFQVLLPLVQCDE